MVDEKYKIHIRITLMIDEIIVKHFIRNNDVGAFTKRCQ